MKSALFYSYVAAGLTICVLFGVAAKAGWRIPTGGVGGRGGTVFPAGGRSTWGTFGVGK